MVDQHQKWADGRPLRWTSSKAVCVGRNYRDHARELNNAVPTEPVLFIKPSTAIVCVENGLSLPPGAGSVHHEVELAFLVGKTINRETSEPWKNLCGLTLALDLTLREKQHALKAAGLPWEKSKAFDGSCVVGPWLPCLSPLERHRFLLHVNGELRQQGDTSEWLFALPELLDEARRWFTLLPGDLVLTGTPAGVGPLRSGDVWLMELDGRPLAEGRVK